MERAFGPRGWVGFEAGGEGVFLPFRAMGVARGGVLHFSLQGVHVSTIVPISEQESTNSPTCRLR